MPERKEVERRSRGAVAHNVLTFEQTAELRTLYDAYLKATYNALEVLKSEGMGSPLFFEADLEAGKINSRIKEIFGNAGRH